MKFYGLGQENNTKHKSKRHFCSLSAEEDDILQSIMQQKAEESFVCC